MSEIQTDDYRGPDRRGVSDIHPPRFTDALHLKPAFAYTLAAGIIAVTGFVYTLQGDVRVNSQSIANNREAVKSEIIERKAADAIAATRMTRSEDDMRRANERLSDKMDEIKTLLIRMMQSSGANARPGEQP